jgi:hypothetical protein
MIKCSFSISINTVLKSSLHHS